LHALVLSFTLRGELIFDNDECISQDGERWDSLKEPNRGGDCLKVQTSRFGEIDVDEGDIISLPEGLIGFPELVRYVLLDHDSDSPFKWLQSVDEGSMAFVVISPLTFRPDYTVEVTEEEISTLHLDNAEDAVISVIVTIPMDPKKMSANLKAPLVFNLKNRLGKQVIVKDAQYQTKHFIMEEIKKYAKKDAISDAKKSAASQNSEAQGNNSGTNSDRSSIG
jgi:flagellar assembly factor FliW